MTPESYKFLSSPSQFTSATQMTTRKSLLSTVKKPPVERLNFDVFDMASETTPLRRLRRRHASPLDDDAEISRSPSPSPNKPRNAFTALKSWVPPDRTSKARPQTGLAASEFIEEEAVESDEDDQYGFGVRKSKDDDEDEGLDPDQTLAELVDDTVLDKEVQNEDAVLEKVR